MVLENRATGNRTGKGGWKEFGARELESPHYVQDVALLRTPACRAGEWQSQGMALYRELRTLNALLLALLSDGHDRSCTESDGITTGASDARQFSTLPLPRRSRVSEPRKRSVVFREKDLYTS